MNPSREQIIKTTCELLETQGYHATGLNEIIQKSGAPKGSLYYYFPQGKEALAAEAIQHAGRIITERIRTSLDAVADPAEAIRGFIYNLTHHVVASGYQAGGPVTTVALESATTNERINAACREVYAEWEAAFAAKLEQSGFEPQRAARLATLIIATLEGGIILSRTEHSPTPLENVAEELALLIKRA
jgi:TetR/AcrR family transcriptional repressor of lmrAB and yxaGH operons